MEDMSRGDDWRSLCEMATQEKDPQKVLDLITKINRALEECHQRNRTGEGSSKVETVLAPIRSSSQYNLDIYCSPEERSRALEYDC